MRSGAAVGVGTAVGAGRAVGWVVTSGVGFVTPGVGFVTGVVVGEEAVPVVGSTWMGVLWLSVPTMMLDPQLASTNSTQSMARGRSRFITSETV